VNIMLHVGNKTEELILSFSHKVLEND